MLDIQKIGVFIAEKRRQHGLTQQWLAGRLSISFQAASKWENGPASPNIEQPAELAAVPRATADELLAGRDFPFWEKESTAVFPRPVRSNTERVAAHRFLKICFRYR